MTDVFTRAKRSAIMRSIHSTGTGPEKRLHALLRQQGLRVQMHPGGLPATPDILLRPSRLAIFVHGCFWHSHQGCKRGAAPHSNRSFWIEKLKKNRARDRRAARALREHGLRVFTIWTCKLKDEARLTRRILRAAQR